MCQTVRMTQAGQFQPDASARVFKILKHLLNLEAFRVARTGQLAARFGGNERLGLGGRRRPILSQVKAHDRMPLGKADMGPKAAFAG